MQDGLSSKIKSITQKNTHFKSTKCYVFSSLIEVFLEKYPYSAEMQDGRRPSLNVQLDNM